ncbi:MAG: S9 family peptidase [Nitrospirae bacterium]|nr:S9 family peptidase [Nitrospirota bacterium]
MSNAEWERPAPHCSSGIRHPAFVTSILFSCAWLWLSAATAAELPALIPRELLFGNPERATPQLSPDGKYLAYTAPDERGVMQIRLRTLGREDDKTVTADTTRGIRRYRWTYDGAHLLYSKDNNGDEVWHAYSVDIHSGLVRDLTPFQGVYAQILALDPDVPSTLLIAMGLKNPRRPDVYRVNLANGAVDLDTANPGNVISWLADSGLQIRAAVASGQTGGQELLVRTSAAAPWKSIRQWEATEPGEAVSFSPDGKTLYYADSRGANTKRLLALDLTSGTDTVIAEDPQYDIGGGDYEFGWQLFDPAGRKLQAAGFYRDRLDWRVLDRTIEADLKTLAKLHTGQFAVVSRDLADAQWIVAYHADDQPISYYLYQRAARSGRLLFSEQSALASATLAAMRPITFKARDGLLLHGYLTTPAGVKPKNLPTVLLVHGGPWQRDLWGYNPTVQWLANRGYVVLRVNFRGSSGYGKAFLNAGNREWGGKMQDDLIDGVDWLVKQGIADPKRVAIMGRSFGGYAVLAGLAFTPERFAVGIAGSGPSNLLTYLAGTPPPMKPLMAKRVGDPDADAEWLKLRSPFFFVDRIRAPLLIGQGANDPRVKPIESEQIVDAMRKAGKPVEYLLYPDEGHYFLKAETRLDFNAKAEEFLGKYLGGRVQAAPKP